MAACGSLRQIFDMPEKPSMIDPMSSWSQIKALKPASSTEIFSELHFQENPPPPAPSNSPPPLERSTSLDPPPGGKPKSNAGFSTKNSESLQLCTEGLGFESSADVDDLANDSGDDWVDGEKAKDDSRLDDGAEGHPRSCSEVQLKSGSGGGFPPPIASIGRTGVCFRSYREDGRFVLREVRVPTQEFLHASREDGRLKLHFVHPNEDIEEEEEEEEEEEGKEVQKRQEEKSLRS